MQERVGTLRITAQLIRASDGFHVSSRVYDRKLSDGLEAQDALAKNIAERCHNKICADFIRRDILSFAASNAGPSTFTLMPSRPITIGRLAARVTGCLR